MFTSLLYVSCGILAHLPSVKDSSWVKLVGRAFWPLLGPSYHVINYLLKSGQYSDWATPECRYHSHWTFLHYSNGMFWIVVLLELLIVIDLELSVDSFLFSSMMWKQFSFLVISWAVMRFPVLWQEKHPISWRFHYRAWLLALFLFYCRLVLSSFIGIHYSASMWPTNYKLYFARPQASCPEVEILLSMASGKSQASRWLASGLFQRAYTARLEFLSSGQLIYALMQSSWSWLVTWMLNS